jgi:hypothetical protein
MSFLLLLLLAGAAAVRFGAVSDDFRFVPTVSLDDARALGGVVQGSFDEDVKPTGWATLRVTKSRQKVFFLIFIIFFFSRFVPMALIRIRNKLVLLVFSKAR